MGLGCKRGERSEEKGLKKICGEAAFMVEGGRWRREETQMGGERQMEKALDVTNTENYRRRDVQMEVEKKYRDRKIMNKIGFEGIRLL